MKHFYLILTGVVLTLAPLIEGRIFKTQIAQTDWRLFIDSYSQPIGLFLLFLATFRAWNEQKEIAETASPEGLRAELAELRRNQQRTLTQDQIEIMSAYFRSVPREEKTGISIKVRQNNPESGRYAEELSRFCAWHALGGGISADAGISRDLVGLVIRVKDNRAAPPIARHLSEALRLANIESRIEALPNLQFALELLIQCELVVGKNS